MIKKNLFLLFSIAVLLLLVGCNGKEAGTGYHIAVFVPGQLDGSPTYEMMDAGVRQAAEEKNAAVTTIEAGYNQAEWESKLMAIAAESRYNLIVTSNPSMPEICRRVREQYKSQHFLVLDGNSIEDDTIMTFAFNHMEQAFLAGYFAGLLTQAEDIEGINQELKVGMIVGQLYPDMERQIIPGFEIGIKNANPATVLDKRVLGNWYDAEAAAELSRSIYNGGADVILPIAGGANQGILTTSEEMSKYLVWFDVDNSSASPNTILSASIIREDEAAYNSVIAIMNGEMQDGDSQVGNLQNGYVDFVLDSRSFKNNVPSDIREKMEEMVEAFKSGEKVLRESI